MTYYTYRIGGGVICECLTNVTRRPIPLRLDLANHSPTGFEFGYGGSGPSQLALAILADYLNDDKKALSLYQDFKWEFIAKADKEFWITEDQIKEWIKSKEIK